MSETFVLGLVTIVSAATPLLLAALGELVVERSGVLNLGVEGMMLAGAVTGFAVTVTTGSPTLGIICAMAAGMAMAFAFGVLTLSLMANQVATGLALTIFGIGLSSLVGAGFVGIAIDPLPKLNITGLSTIPVIGPLLFGHDILIYASVALTAGVAWFLKRSRPGMILRAVGESDESAHSIGYDVIRVRYMAVLFGGLTSGLAGAFLSLSYTPMWIENMTAGRGWIALALVVFATWRPFRVLLGAYLFGGVMVAQLFVQGSGLEINIPSQLLSSLPYLATIVVLVIISRDRNTVRLNAPVSLGQPYRPEA